MSDRLPMSVLLPTTRWTDACAELAAQLGDSDELSVIHDSEDDPAKAHLSDPFDYFNWRLKGSDHYSSTGILFTTYYFEREGSRLLNGG